MAAGTVTLCNDTVQSNSALGGLQNAPGQGFGGGIYIVSGATVYIDAANVDNKDPTVVNNNTDSSGMSTTPYSSTANIDGTYILQNC